MDGLLLFWIGLCLTFVLLETATPSLFFFLAGALGACFSIVVFWLGLDFHAQAGAFLITSILSLMALKYALKHLSAFKTHHHQRTNSQALIGKTAKVILTISPDERGFVKINGQMWAAEEIRHKEILADSHVEIVAVSGAHVKVKKIHKQLKDIS